MAGLGVSEDTPVAFFVGVPGPLLASTPDLVAELSAVVSCVVGKFGVFLAGVMAFFVEGVLPVAFLDGEAGGASPGAVVNFLGASFLVGDPGTLFPGVVNFLAVTEVD